LLASRALIRAILVALSVRLLMFWLVNMIQIRKFAISNKSSLRAQLLRGGIGVGGLKILSMILTMASSILFARGLGPDGYGKYVFVMAIIGLIALPVGPGYGQYITREVARYHLEEKWGLFRGILRRANQWVGVSSVLIALVIVVVASRQATWTVDDRWTLIFVASLMLPLLGFGTLQSSVLRGLSCVFHAQIPELLVRPGLHLLIAGGILMTGILSPVTVLISQICAATGARLLGAWFVRRNRPKLVTSTSPQYLNREWGKALWPFMLIAAVGALNSQLGVLALGWFGDHADVGLLRVAQSGSMLVALSLVIVNLVIGPYVARAHRAGDIRQLMALSRQSAFAAVVVALPIALPLIFLGGPIVRLIYGEVYADGATLPLAILAGAELINVAFGSVVLFLVMSGYERDALVGQITALLVTALAAIVLIPAMGVVGAALAVSTGLVTWNVVLAFMFTKRLHFKPSFFAGNALVRNSLKEK
jgi:O-antigen/teichoic acid export membrane protein